MKNQLKYKLLHTESFTDYESDPAMETTGVRGEYNPMQFVVRLHKDVHKALENIDEVNFEKAQAFSTFMHETIHWWQHIGSNFGFISSLSYPVIAHTIHRDLKTLISREEKYRPIINYDNLLYLKQDKPHGNREVNSILNNYYDIMYAKKFALDNRFISQIAQDKRFFKSIGHSYRILWTSAIFTIADLMDPNFNFLPNVEKWAASFEKLAADRVLGFYDDSDYIISPLGTKAIYEGQARFNQLQFLTIASDNKLTYTDFEQMGMLDGVYIEAFELFLKISGINKPQNLNNSVVGLFLLICDIAINPTDGFPLNPTNFAGFINLNDPGIRFCFLCTPIKQDNSKWLNAIQEYSSKEYINVASELCNLLGFTSPHIATEVVKNWIPEYKSIQDLIEEEAIMKFSAANMPIRLFLSKYIRFQVDKFEHPCFFCWTGKSMTHEKSPEFGLDIVEKLFNRHQSLYIDDMEGVIKASLFQGGGEENIRETFDAFYSWNTSYNMVLQWIKSNQEFNYDLRWLTTKQSPKDMKNWVRNNFKAIFNIYPEELQLII